MIAESITAIIETLKVMKKQYAVDKASQAALAMRVAKVDKESQDLLQNHKIMQ